MKIVFASTIEQEQEMEDLISTFYQSVFPQFFTQAEIQHFQDIGVLQANHNHFSYNGTLRAAYQVITCLRVMMTILEKKIENSSPPLKLQNMFEQNSTLLNHYGIFFPFNYEHFTYSISGEDHKLNEMKNIQPANQYLI